jgi:hypothetical protein
MYMVARATRTHRRTLVKTHLIEHVIKHTVSKFAEARITGGPDLVRISATYDQPVCDLMKARRMVA